MKEKGVMKVYELNQEKYTINCYFYDGRWYLEKWEGDFRISDIFLVCAFGFNCKLELKEFLEVMNDLERTGLEYDDLKKGGIV